MEWNGMEWNGMEWNGMEQRQGKMEQRGSSHCEIILPQFLKKLTICPVPTVSKIDKKYVV